MKPVSVSILMHGGACLFKSQTAELKMLQPLDKPRLSTLQELFVVIIILRLIYEELSTILFVFYV